MLMGYKGVGVREENEPYQWLMEKICGMRIFEYMWDMK